MNKEHILVWIMYEKDLITKNGVLNLLPEVSSVDQWANEIAQIYKDCDGYLKMINEY